MAAEGDTADNFAPVKAFYEGLAGAFGLEKTAALFTQAAILRRAIF